MKLTLTKAELLPILTGHFKMPVTDITIETTPAVPTAAELITNAIKGLRYTSDQKIMAIKALRQVTADHTTTFSYVLGLADAKWAMENFNRFITFVTGAGRLPHAGFCDGTLR